MVTPVLHDYQRYAADYVKARTFSGLFLDMGLGKAIDNDTLIPTIKGFKRVKDIVIGDKLFNRRGEITTVLKTHPHKNKRAFRVTLRDGRPFIVCDEHLIPYYTVNSWKKKDLKHKPLKEFLTDYVYRHPTQNSTSYKYQLPQNSAVLYDETPHTIHPYALGMLIGNGLLNEPGFVISRDNEELALRTAEKLNIPKDDIRINHKTKRTYYTKHDKAKKIQYELDRLGLHRTTSKDRFIPDAYLIDSKDNRLALLKGLMDSNGHIQHTRNNGFTYGFLTVSESLKDGVLSLARSLGYGATTSQRSNKTYQISIYTNDIIVTYTKHLEKLKNRSYQGSLDKKVSIVDIKEVEPRDMTCFTVDDPEHLFLMNDYIVTHNTLITLTALSELAVKGQLNGHVLVIAPKKIAMTTWPSEIEKWDHTKNAKYTVLSGLTKKKRDEKLSEVFQSPSQFYFINPELIPQLVDMFGEYWPFKNVVIDEVQTFKSYKSTRFKKLKMIRPYINRMIALTGTPAPSSLMDLWPQITLLDSGRRLGKNITSYRETFFDPGARTAQGYPYEWWIKPNGEDAIYDRIDDIVISMKAKDHLKMPGITYNNVDVTMTNKERKVYKTMKKEHVLPLVDGGEITSANAATLSAQLLQLANGAIYMDSKTRDVAVLHNQKLDALEQIIDSSQGSPLLVFYWYQHDLKRIKERFGEDITIFDGSRDHIDRWNNKEFKVMLAQPASAGHGLNLQEGGHIIVWFSLPSASLGVYQQANARIYRQGQTEPVIVHHILTKGTVDKGLLRSLQHKEVNQDRLMNAVKAELSDVID